MKEVGLDYEIQPEFDGGFMIWTPDTTGAVIGSGITVEDAVLDAINNMNSLALDLRRELKTKVPLA